MMVEFDWDTSMYLYSVYVALGSIQSERMVFKILIRQDKLIWPPKCGGWMVRLELIGDKHCFNSGFLERKRRRGDAVFERFFAREKSLAQSVARYWLRSLGGSG